MTHFWHTGCKALHLVWFMILSFLNHILNFLNTVVYINEAHDDSCSLKTKLKTHIAYFKIGEVYYHTEKIITQKNYVA